MVHKKRVRLATTRRGGVRRRRVGGGSTGGVAADPSQQSALLKAIEGMDFSHISSACRSSPSPAQTVPATDASLCSPRGKRQCKEEWSTAEPQPLLTSAHVPTCKLLAEAPLLAGSASHAPSGEAAAFDPARSNSAGRVSVVKETPMVCTGGGGGAEVRGHLWTAAEATPTMLAGVAQDKTPPPPAALLQDSGATMATSMHTQVSLCGSGMQQDRGDRNDNLELTAGATLLANTDLAQKDSDAHSPSSSAGLCSVASLQPTSSSTQSQSPPQHMTSQSTLSPTIPLQNLPPPPPLLPCPPTRPTGSRTIRSDTLSQASEGERTTIPDTYRASEKKVYLVQSTPPQHVSPSQPSPTPSGPLLPGLKARGAQVMLGHSSSQPPPSLSTIPDTLWPSQHQASPASGLQELHSIATAPSTQPGLTGKCRLCYKHVLSLARV